MNLLLEGNEHNDEAWHVTRGVAGEYTRDATDPVKSLKSGRSDCLSFALIHYALALPDQEDPSNLALIRTRRVADSRVHFFNLCINTVGIPGKLYDHKYTNNTDSPLHNLQRIVNYYPDNIKEYVDIMMGVIPGETEYGTIAEVNGYELTYCNPVSVLGRVCSDKSLTLSGLAMAAHNRLYPTPQEPRLLDKIKAALGR